MPAPQIINVNVSRHVINEIPLGDVDGTNTLFNTKFAFRTNTILLFLNGIRLSPGSTADYIEGPGNNAITLNEAPEPGDILIVDYLRS